ncbi:hypothetical protein ABEB36_000589 [Hypothenemus hampei]|uniref:Protein quiver n=1 Tax=Hypothenemus hampei TaxID=57062 RepID=A0ABD1FDM9_HYPHA
MIMLLKCFLPLFLGISLISRTSSLKCYSCGEYEEDKNSCANFTIQDPKFSRECPEDTKSCRLTRKPNDNLILSRTCESIKLDDCKTANSIEFCYCTKDLCNAINPLNDDEDDDDLDDFFEGNEKVDMRMN